MTQSTPPISVNWRIASLEREAVDGYVFLAHYRVEAADEINSCGVYGTVGFDRPEKLIPYADLTEEQVIGWVKDALGSERVLAIGQKLLENLREQRQPTKISGLPWAG